LPNVGPYIYDVSISGFTRSSIYIYDISSLRVKYSEFLRGDTYLQSGRRHPASSITTNLHRPLYNKQRGFPILSTTKLVRHRLLCN